METNPSTSEAIRIDQREEFGRNAIDRFSSGRMLLSLNAGLGSQGGALGVIWQATPETWAEFYDAVLRIGRGIRPDDDSDDESPDGWRATKPSGPGNMSVELADLFNDVYQCYGSEESAVVLADVAGRVANILEAHGYSREAFVDVASMSGLEVPS